MNITSEGVYSGATQTVITDKSRQNLPDTNFHDILDTQADAGAATTSSNVITAAPPAPATIPSNNSWAT